MEKKLGEFIGVCVLAFVVFIIGVIDQPFFGVISILALVILLVGTLSILGLTE